MIRLNSSLPKVKINTEGYTISFGNVILREIAGDLDIAALPAKATPITGDKLIIADSEDSNALKNIDFGDIGGGDLTSYFNMSLNDLDDITDGTTYKKFSATEQSKLSGIAAGAEVNVNADWNAASGDAQILNKPTIPDSLDDLSGTLDSITAGTTNVHLTSTLKSNYDAAYSHSGASHAPADAEKNVQADWNQADNAQDDYIKNKPTIPTLISDHGGLSGLTDDDHSQYLLAAGTRALTGIQSYQAHPTFTTDTSLVDKKYVDDAITGSGGYTDEQAQDAVGNAVGNGLDYDDATGAISVDESELSLPFVKLDQTSSQSIINGQPIQNTLTASELVATDAVKKLSSLAVATYPSLTEISYVKGVTSAVQTQLNAKQATLVSGTNIKTINTNSLLGSGDLTIAGGDASTNTATSVDNEIALFSSTGGKTLKRATSTGILKATSGVIGTASAGDGDAIVSAASDTVAGKIEIATAAETTTGTDTGRAICPDGLAGSTIFGRKTVQIMVFEPTTDWATGDGKAYFVVPENLNGMNLVRVHARVITAGTTNTSDIQLRNVTDSVDILSTKITIDSTETGSDSAATAAVIDTTKDDVATNDLIAIDIDAASTTKPKGLIVTIEFQLP